MTKQFKPMLACNADINKLPNKRYYVQPKIDGVRGLVVNGKLVGRSLKQFKNKFITRVLSKPEFDGLDFEILAGTNNTVYEGSCRITTSLVNTIDEIAPFQINVFDCFLEPEKSYEYRIKQAEDIACNMGMFLRDKETGTPFRVNPISPLHFPECLSRIMSETIERYAGWGYEGSVLRSLGAPYKFGRATLKEGSFLKFKNYIDFNFVILSGEEAQENNNEATINELGHTSRSTHKENLTGKGIIGAIWGKLLEDVKTDTKTFLKGETVKLGAGKMSHEDRKRFFEHPEEFVGKIGVGKVFAYGIKDKLRHATFQHIRADEDVSY